MHEWFTLKPSIQTKFHAVKKIKNKWHKKKKYAMDKWMTNMLPNLINMEIIKCKGRKKKCKRI